MKRTLGKETLFGLLITAVASKAMAASLEFNYKDPKEISAVSLSLDSKLEPIVGYAKGISGIVHFDPANPQATTGTIAVDVNSVQFANEGYTATARGYALRGDKYPQITFTLRKVLSGKLLPDANQSGRIYQGRILADFTCKGITLPLVLPITASYYPGLAEERTNGKFKGDVLVLRTQFGISRKKLGISQGIPDSMVGDTIQVGVAIVGLHVVADAKSVVAISNASGPEGQADPNKTIQAQELQRTKEKARAQLDQPVSLNVNLPEIRTDHKQVLLNVAKLGVGQNVVLFFFSEQCGVTFHYKHRFNKLLKDYDHKAFKFIGIRCGNRENPKEPLNLAEAKYLKLPYLDDVSGALLKTFNVKQSLTFAVIDKAGIMRYHGGFDDTVTEKLVKHAYLRNALDAVATGKSVPIKEGHAIGCAILPIE